jgi:hypothetical protein
MSADRTIPHTSMKIPMPPGIQPTRSQVSYPPSWTPPVIYDFTTDTYRAATQGDIDRLLMVERALMDLVRAAERAKACAQPPLGTNPPPRPAPSEPLAKAL